MLLHQTLTGKWQFRQAEADEWYPAQVPGGVHTDLLAAGLIPDPFVADNEKRVQWIAATDWEYRRTFTVEAGLLAQQQIFLVGEGLDTLAEVTLNGQKLGRTDNMFRQYRWEVKSLLDEGDNELSITFDSPLQYVAPRQAERPMTGVPHAIPGGPYLRKAPCHFGWDWGPKLLPIGIWQDIRLEGRNVAKFDDIHLRQHHQAGTVVIEAAISLERWQDDDLTAVMRVSGPDGVTLTGEASISGDGQVVAVTIEQPRLWWPNGYGDQPLYQVELALTDGEHLYDRRSYQVGLRTLELRQVDDEWGKSFTFVVNGVPIFAKGANWIPADSFPTRLTTDHLEMLIRAAADTYQNMLRVWGGGFYEEERFYDLCDQYGILVWQDFIFACSVYPMDDDAFLENVRREVDDNVRRLRHRASLALWCGNNEMEWGWESWGWAGLQAQPELDDLAEKIPELKPVARQLGRRRPSVDWEILRDAYEQFFFSTLPEWVAHADSATPYWPSSPSSNIPFADPNGQAQGDAHYWDVWHGGQPFTAYRDQFPRFMSEFGFQALPPLATIRTFADEADWNMTSYIMEHHQKNDSGNGLIIGQMAQTFRMPQDFPALVYLSLILQAEGIRYGVEHWRRNMHRVSGTLYWQLNDCWPVASWSSLDYFGRWKALHYAARRFYAPVMLSIEDAPPQMGLHVTSDLTQPWTGTIRWSLETLGGEVLESGEETVSAEPLSSTHIRTLDFVDQISDDNRRQVVFVAELWQGSERVALNIGLFAPNKHLALVEPELTVEAHQQGDQLVIDLTAQSLARFVEVSLT
ncbi:MAG TPA: glycoside hydrolase family 2 protein, partial [Anaerolineae bacterium]|nr:glycoside hydrolase family 2 protein [Anaerolineae bacterium]